MGRADAERLQDIKMAIDAIRAYGARMRDRLSHRYFDTAHSIVTGTVEHDLPTLYDAVCRIERNLSA